MRERSITVRGTSFGRPGVAVTFDADGLRGDDFVVEIIERRVEMGWGVSVAGVTSGPATLDLDDALLTACTMAGAFDTPSQDVTFVGLGDPYATPPGAEN